VLNKLITRSLRSLGMILIFLFAAFAIIGSIFVRNIDSSTVINKFLDYTISFENRYYDFRMKSQLDMNIKSKEIVLVKIDDYSLQSLGVWPIPRTLHAKMLDKLRVFGAKVVALDILYPEKSPSYGEVSPDTVFALSIKNFQQNGRRVFLAYTTAQDGDEHLPEAPVEMLNDAILTRNVPEVDFEPKKISKYTFPIEELVSTEVGLANITSTEDPDGIFRHYKLVSNIDTIYYGSLGLNAYEAYMGEKKTIKIFSDATGEIEIDGKKMEITPEGEVKIRYVGAENAFTDVPLYDLLQASDSDEKMKEIFNGKMVFVGSTALGAHDLRPSPISAKMPGVYAHINLANMLLNKYFYQNSNESVKYSLIFLVAGMILFLIVQRFNNAILDTIIIATLVAIAYYADKHYFMPNGYELKLFYCFFCFISCYSWNTFFQFYETSKEKKQIRGTFARYVAPTVVDEMLKDPEKLHVGGTKMDITCLFSDVRDFTHISEGLTATELAHSLNLYMGAMTDIVFDTKGTLDKYIGDAIVALWGAPLPIGNHAQFAVEAAIQMMNKLPSINEEFKRLGRPVFNVGIGLNSGECSVGNMGSHRIFSYTALGDNMNLGARLESLCKHYGAQILISDMTLLRIDRTIIKTRPIDKVVVKGKTHAVEIHEVLHDHHWMAKDSDSLSYYLKGHEHFQAKNFSEALDVFGQLLTSNEKDLPTRRLYDLCRKYLSEPYLVTEQFDVTTMTEK
jgi:adenylate cyclase